MTTKNTYPPKNRSQMRKIGFNRTKTEVIIRRIGKNNIAIDQNGVREITPEYIKSLTGKPTKIRFIGLSRAQMGNFISSVKSNGMNAYVKPVRMQKTGRIPYYEVLITEDQNE